MHYVNKILSTALLLFCVNVSSNILKFQTSNILDQRERWKNPDLNITKVHFVFMNHLDVGYIGPMTKVMNMYFQTYFPRAITIAQQLKDEGYRERLVYTTHPWLVSMYMDCPPNLNLSDVKLYCPNATEIARFEKAVKRGDINWHAGPMNMQYEYADPTQFEWALNLSYTLDQWFNITRKSRVVSQRDVPGTTQTTIPYLQSKGIIGISVGVNFQSAPPAVGNPFLWKFGQHEVIGAWSPNGYPVNPGPDPAHPGGLSRCAKVPGFTEVLCFAFRSDNSGPPESKEEVLSNYEVLRGLYPNAEIIPSPIESFFQALWPHRQNLDVVTKEIGDTWIMGAGSDPGKNADFRAVSRVLAQCVQQGECSYTDPRVFNVSRFMMKNFEHTWGIDTVRDNVNWSNAQFATVKSSPNFALAVQTWSEQRSMSQLAVQALQDHPVVPQVMKELDKTKPQRPDLTNYEEISFDSVTKCGSISIGFGLDGSLSTLTNEKDVWANSDSPMAAFTYVTYNDTDMAYYRDHYEYNGIDTGFTKGNITVNAHPRSRRWPTTMNALYRKKGSSCELLSHIEMVDEEPCTLYGAPQDVWTSYTIRQQPNPGLDITMDIWEKTATRLPESITLTFRPAKPNLKWFVSKLGMMIDPLNVVKNGSQYQHGTDEGLFYMEPSGKSGLHIAGLDTPVSVVLNNQFPHGQLYPVPLSPITQISGMGFNIYNNVWNTNYIFWYPYTDDYTNIRARFAINFVTKESKLASEISRKLKALGR